MKLFNGGKWVGLALAGTTVALGAPLNSLAATVLVPASSIESTQGDDPYPESRFGYGPSKVETGVGPSYTARATREIDEEPVDVPRSHSGAARRPAGLEADDGTKGPNAPRAAAGAWEDTRPTRGGSFSESSEFSRSHGSSELNPVSGAMANPIARKGIQEIAVIASDLGYFPRTLFVVRDMPVRLYVTGASRNTLCIMMDSFQVRKQVRSQRIEEISFTPATPGKFRFYCPVNGMEGTLIVKELSTGPSAKEQAASDDSGTKTAKADE